LIANNRSSVDTIPASSFCHILCALPKRIVFPTGTQLQIFSRLIATHRRASAGAELALQLPFMQVSESMGNHDSKIVDAASVD
jgi:hypothetical protein